MASFSQHDRVLTNGVRQQGRAPGAGGGNPSQAVVVGRLLVVAEIQVLPRNQRGGVGLGAGHAELIDTSSAMPQLL